MTRRNTAVFMAVLLLALAVTAQAASTAKQVPKTVTLELSDTTVVEAFETLFKGRNVNYILQPGVGGTLASLKLRDLPFDKALNALAKAAGLEVNFEDGVYIIGKPAPKAVVVQARPEAGEQGEATQPQDLQQVNVNQPGFDNSYYPQQYQGYQGYQGYYNDQYPVYYGGYGVPQGYYNQGYGYGPGYGYGGYGYGYGSPQVYVPAYRSGPPQMLPGPGVPWSAGIGRVRITNPTAPVIPTPQQ